MNEKHGIDKQRNLVIDMLRGLCMILIVIGHSGTPIVAYIYVFHVPIFFILSGFTTDLKNSVFSEFILKRFVSLIVPFCGINVGLLLLRKFMHIWGVDHYFYDVPISTSAGLQSIFFHLNAPTDLGGATWFLVVLFWSSIFAKLIFDLLANKAKINLLLIILAAFTCLYPLYKFWDGQKYLPLNLDLGLYGAFFYLLGFYICKLNIIPKIKISYGLTISVLLLIFFGNIRFAPMNWPTRSFDSPFTNVLSVLAGFYIMYQLAQLLLLVPYVNRIGIFIGEKTIYILSMHFLAFKFFYLLLYLLGLEPQSILKSLVLPFNNRYWILLTAFACFFSLILAIWGSKITFIDFVFTGKYVGNYSYVKNKIFPFVFGKNSEELPEQHLITNKIFRNEILLVIAIFLSLAANYWVITPENGFAFDDYSYIFHSQFHSYNYSILPTMQYNDRPVGQFLIYTLLNNFGMNYIPSHFVFLVIHLINVTLVFYLSKEILNWFDIQFADLISFLTATIFGVWSASTMCVQWLAAAFDLLGATFFFSGMLLYFLTKRTDNRFRKTVYTIAIALIFFLGLRTKEMTITLPIIIFLLEGFHTINIKKIQIKSFGREPSLWILLIIMFSYGLLLLSLSSNGITSVSDSPYLINPSLSIIARNFLRYQIMYFDLTSESFSFQFYTAWTLLVVVFLFLLSLYFSLRENILFGGLYILLFIVLLPVLPLQNMQHRLYLYIPSFFFGLIASSILNTLFKKVNNINNENYVYFFNLVLAVCIAGNIFLPSVRHVRSYWKYVWNQNAITISDIKSISPPENDTIIYITGVNNGENVFIYGPGYINNILFENESLKTVLGPKQNDNSAPYLLWQFKDGEIIEIQRED